MNALNTRIVLKNDTLSNWMLNQSVILLKGEIGIEFSDNGDVKLKIGDGVTPWPKLKYFGKEVVGDKKSIEIINNTLQLAGYDTAAIGSYPVKGKDGSITWVISEAEEVEHVKTEITDLRTIIGTDATDTAPATGLFAIVNEKANITDVYTKPEIDSMLGSVYRYRGSIPSYDDLPQEGQIVGDVWNIESNDPVHDIKAGDNVAWNGLTWDRLAGSVDLIGYVTHEEFFPIKTIVEEIPLIYITQQQAETLLQPVKYEVIDKPNGTLVDYREKEIRIMCPDDTEWKSHQDVQNFDPKKSYIGIKVYAPNDNVVSFKEDFDTKITDTTMYYFENNTFAGVDEYGRKYSIIWLPVAQFNEDNQSWEYSGAMSSTQKFIGSNYTVEWYDESGTIIGTDTIRINFTNDRCHNAIEPYYMSEVIRGIKYNGTLLDNINGIIEINLPGIKTSTEQNKISINDDGTMEVNSLNVNKLVQNDDEYILLYGGSSVF